MFSEISLVVSLKVRIYNGGKKTVFPRFTIAWPFAQHMVKNIILWQELLNSSPTMILRYRVFDLFELCYSPSINRYFVVYATLFYADSS